MNYYNYTVELLKKLVSVPTDKQNEADVMPILVEELKKHGFKNEYQNLDNGRKNLVASYGTSDKKLVFCGHLDVVPAGENWNESEPFNPVFKDGKICGRGTTDMKGGIASFISAAIKATNENFLTDTEIIIALVSDEEVNSSGAIHFASNLKVSKDTLIIIGEPTELDIYIAHKGIAQFDVTIKGKQCHSSQPQNGVNSIYEAMRFVKEIESLNLEFGKIKCDILPSPNITVTKFNSGTAANIIPGVAEFTVDCRTVVGMTDKTLLQRFTEIADRLYSGSKTEYSIKTLKYKPATCLNNGNKAIELVSNATQAVFGKMAKIKVFDACCDLFCFDKSGFTSAVACGPGSLKQAHIKDEFIEIKELEKAVDLYFEIIKELSESGDKI